MRAPCSRPGASPPSPAKFPEILAPLRHVLWAETADGALEISVVAKKSRKKNAALALVHISGKVAGKEEEAKAFADAVLEAAYRGVLLDVRGV